MPPVPLHKLFLSYPESFQFVNSSLGLESEEETFSSHLSEPLLMAEGGSESRTGGGLQAGGVGGGLLPRVWLQLPGQQTDLRLGHYCADQVRWTTK